MASIERGPACMLVYPGSAVSPPGSQTSIEQQNAGAETATPDSSKSRASFSIGKSNTSSLTGIHGYDVRPDRGSVFLLSGLDQRGQAVNAGGIKYYLMIGYGTSGAAHSWKVSGSPDFTGAFYIGIDGPITSIYLAATWAIV